MPAKVTEIILGVTDKHLRANAVVGHSQHELTTGKSCLTENKLRGLCAGSPAASPTTKQFFCSQGLPGPFFPVPTTAPREELPPLPHRAPSERGGESWLPSTCCFPQVARDIPMSSPAFPGGKGHPHQLSCLPQVARDTHNLVKCCPATTRAHTSDDP